MTYEQFKEYMKQLVTEYRTDYMATYIMKHDETMRPDFYWFEKFLNDELEWTEKDNTYIRK